MTFNRDEPDEMSIEAEAEVRVDSADPLTAMSSGSSHHPLRSAI
ncbi:MAG: hypothetical protein ACKOYG_08030 [Ilumatobacteraceae bacterium]